MTHAVWLRASVVLLTSLLAACSASESAPKGSPPPTVPVEVVAVASGVVPLEVSAVGTVETLASVALRSRVEGEVVDVRVRDGQDVRAGDLLLQIDPRSYEIAVLQAEAALARDQAQLEKTQAQETRFQRLAPQGYVSADDYAQVRANLSSAQAAVKTSEAALAQARLQVQHTRITAPISGRIGKVLLQKGNLVRPADANPLLVINQLQPIAVSFAVPQQSLGEVRAAMAKGSPAVVVRAQGLSATGKLDFLDNTVDASTGTLKLRGVFVNEDRTLWPGLFVEVALQLSEQADAISVPQRAVMNGPKGSYVFVLKADNTAELRLVSVLRHHRELAVVSEGLKAGERVVLDGQSRVTPGSTLRVVDAAAQP